MSTGPAYTAEGVPREKVDHLQLWQYFEGRGSALKDSFLQMMTWVLGFGGALVAFAADKTLNWKPGEPLVGNRLTLLLVSIVGLSLVFFALRVISEFGEHINRNFDRADRARDATTSLEEILAFSERPEAKAQKLPSICRKVRIIVVGFGAAFSLGILLALYKAL